MEHQRTINVLRHGDQPAFPCKLIPMLAWYQPPWQASPRSWPHTYFADHPTYGKNRGDAGGKTKESEPRSPKHPPEEALSAIKGKAVTAFLQPLSRSPPVFKDSYWILHSSQPFVCISFRASQAIRTHWRHLPLPGLLDSVNAASHGLPIFRLFRLTKPSFSSNDSTENGHSYFRGSSFLNNF